MLKRVSVVYGTDPELFFEQNGRIIGAEKVIPPGGLKPGRSVFPTVVLDGVQVELHPAASRELRVLGRNISIAFELIFRQLRKTPKVRLSSARMVDVGKAELESLSPESRILGCNESKNIYGNKPLTCDPETYTWRSAGGHLHFGLPADLWEVRESFIAPFDIFIGNTCVLLDRDAGMAARRENYGRAGEYREPTYGVEYRTLSNFWLRAYPLVSLVFGLADIAFSVVSDPYLEAELIEVVDIGKVVEAIDTNNYDLARENFKTIQPFLAKHLPPSGFVLSPSTLNRFLTFADMVNVHDLEFFFEEEPLTHWTKLTKFDSFPEFLQTIY